MNKVMMTMVLALAVKAGTAQTAIPRDAEIEAKIEKTLGKKSKETFLIIGVMSNINYRLCLF